MADYKDQYDFSLEAKQLKEEQEARRGGSVFPKGELDVPRPVETDTTAAKPEIGVERVCNDGINLVPDTVRLKINISYDPTDLYNPFRYELVFPEEMYAFFYDAGLTDDADEGYTGKSIAYRTATDAKRRGEQEALEIGRRYKKYLSDKTQAQSFIYVVQL